MNNESEVERSNLNRELSNYNNENIFDEKVEISGKEKKNLEELPEKEKERYENGSDYSRQNNENQNG